MDITLHNFKHYPKLSEETLAFTADVYVDGKKAGTAENTGKGGQTDIRPRELEDKLIAEAKKLPSHDVDLGKGRVITIQPSAWSVMDTLAIDYVERRELKSKLNSFWVLRKGKEFFKIRKSHVADIPVDVLKAKFRREYDLILNGLPFDEAYQMWRGS